MTTLVGIAESAALAGGHVLAKKAGVFGEIRTKSSSTDYVTDVDIASGIAVASEILRLDPDARLLVEEPEVCDRLGCESATLQDERLWVIDPLDGTTSFMHGYPCFSVSVALLEGGEPVAAAVYNAAAGEMVSAQSGCGATLDGSKIRVTDVEHIPDSLIITGFPYDRGALLDRQLAIFAEVLRTVQGIRRDGSAAIDLTHVAAGRADAFWELALQPWDTSAGVLIVREAGGVVSDLTGEPWRPASPHHVVAANPRLHERLIELIARVEGDS